MNTIKPVNWKIFFILLAGSILGVLAVLPYSLELQKDIFATLPVPMWVVIASSLVQSTILFAIAILAGLWLAGRVGLGLPILQAKLAGESVGDRLKAILPVSIIVGVLGSILIIALEVYVFGPAMKAELGAQASRLNLQGSQPVAWKGLLASFYGGIDEEILLRLFVMSLLVWLGKLVTRTADLQPAPWVFWTASILAAVLFGLGHLPATAVIVPLSPLIILRAVVLNGLLGVALGYLYWKKGLEAAIISHFSADIVLHVLLVLL